MTKHLTSLTIFSLLAPILCFAKPGFHHITESANKRWGLDFDSQSLGMKILTYESELHFAGDCVPGNSGGPVVNEQGKVIGLFNSSVPKETHLVNPNRSCYAVRSSFLVNGSSIQINGTR